MYCIPILEKKNAIILNNFTNFKFYEVLSTPYLLNETKVSSNGGLSVMLWDFLFPNPHLEKITEK